MNQLDSIAALARGHIPLPLIGKLYNLDGTEDRPVFFVATDTINERTIAIVRDLRAASEEAALVVFYRGGEPRQEVPALEAGADDCIALPCDFEYCSARLHASVSRLRRTNHLTPPSPTIGLDPFTHQAVVGDRRFALSPLEFRFLFELHRQPGRVVSHDHLERLLWNDSGRHSRESLKHVVHRLRKRLPGDGAAIVAVPGTGYLLSQNGAPVTGPSPE